MAALAFSRAEKILPAMAAATGVACFSTFLTVAAFVAATWREDTQPWEAAAVGGANGAYFALIAFPPLFALIGLPLYALSVSRSWTSARQYAAVGSTVSGIMALAAWFADLGLASYLMVPSIAIGGTAATLTFWMVARPDRR